MCRGKQGNELLIAERPVQKAADQRRQRRPMPCCSSPLPTKRDAAPRVRSALHRRRPRSSRRRMPARTPALFSSANARTTARLLRGSSFLPSFLCFVFTYFPLYAASRVGKGSSFLLLPSLLPLFAALAFIRTLRLSTRFIWKKETEKRGGAAAGGERRRQGSSSTGSICADTQTSKQQQQQQMQQQQ